MSLIVVSSKRVKIRKPPSVHSKHGYTERNKNLRSLGFNSYSHYLSSEMWSIVRGLAFEKHGKVCVSCSSPATQIHHSGYDMKTLVGADLTHLHPVCRSCHESAEIADGEKQHRDVANEKLGVSGPSSRQEARSRKKVERSVRESARRSSGSRSRQEALLRKRAERSERKSMRAKRKR